MGTKWKARVRKRVLEAQGGVCPYCDRPAFVPTNHHRTHNQNDGFNVVVCCERCHAKINIVTETFRKANDCLRQEIVLSILMIAPPHLAKELIRGQSDRIARLGDATTISAETAFKDMGVL